MTFAERVKFAREIRNLSQPELAEAIGCTPSAIAHWESGDRHGASMRLLKKAADTLHTSVDWLLRGVGDPPPPASAQRPVKVPQIVEGTALPFAVQPGSWTRDLPVYSTKAVNPDVLELNPAEITEWILRPPALFSVAKAYALRCDASQAPVFGDFMCVHPRRPAGNGDYVLVVLKPNNDGEIPQALVKVLAKQTADRIDLTPLHGSKPMTVAMSKVLELHYIVRPRELMKG
jgi:transcriptional regulator with XRE-family HTH domain